MLRRVLDIRVINKHYSERVDTICRMFEADKRPALLELVEVR